MENTSLVAVAVARRGSTSCGGLGRAESFAGELSDEVGRPTASVRTAAADAWAARARAALPTVITKDDDEIGARSDVGPSDGAAAGARTRAPARAATGETRPRPVVDSFAEESLLAVTGELGIVAISDRDCRPMKTGDAPEDDGAGDWVATGDEAASVGRAGGAAGSAGEGCIVMLNELWVLADVPSYRTGALQSGKSLVGAAWCEVAGGGTAQRTGSRPAQKLLPGGTRRSLRAEYRPPGPWSVMRSLMTASAKLKVGEGSRELKAWSLLLADGRQTRDDCDPEGCGAYLRMHGEARADRLKRPPHIKTLSL